MTNMQILSQLTHRIETEINGVVLYVHQLSGGEYTVAQGILDLMVADKTSEDEKPLLLYKFKAFIISCCVHDANGNKAFDFGSDEGQKALYSLPYNVQEHLFETSIEFSECFEFMVDRSHKKKAG